MEKDNQNMEKDNQTMEKDNQKMEKDKQTMEKDNQKMEKDNQKPVKKKKKGRGWLVFLIIVAFIALVIFGIKGTGKLLTEKLTEALPAIPFEFADDDDRGYITEDFKAICVTQDEAEREVTWTSSSPEVINVADEGECAVARPDDRNETVTMTAQAKYLWILTAKAEYELTVVCTEELSLDDVYVPDAKTVESGKGRYAFTVVYTDNDVPYWIYGKLGTQVDSKEDAETVVKAYREFFGVPEAVEFRYSDMAATGEARTYSFDVYYESARLDGYSAGVSVDENGLLTGVTVGLPEILPESSGQPLTEEEQDAILTERYGEFTCLSREYAALEETFAWEICIFTDGSLLEIFMDAVTGEIISEESMIHSLKYVDVSGTDSLGNELTMSVDYPGLFGGQLRDMYRGIYVYKTWLKDSDDDEEETEPETESVEELPVEDNDKDASLLQQMALIMCLKSYYTDGKTVKNTQALSAMYNLQIVYDWYKDEFGWVGTSGNSASIYVIVDYPGYENNAAYGRLTSYMHLFLTGPDTSDLFNGEMCAYTDVMAHEYTHGRFAVFDRSSSCNNEVTSINESYADIFAAFLDGNWEMASGATDAGAVRSIASMASCPGTSYEEVCPMNYAEIDFGNSDPHINGMLLTRCAMEMETKGIVTRQENKEIWFKMVTYGNINNLCTYLTVRENVERAAKEIGLDQEKVDEIGEVFAEHGIGESKKKEVENNSVPGDELLDDTVTHRYMLFWSPLGTAYFGTPIAVVEEKTMLEQVLEKDEVSDRIGNALSDQAASDTDDEPVITVGKIIYTRADPYIIDTISDTCNAGKAKITTTLNETIEDDFDTDALVDMIVECVVYECTPYEFYTEVLGLDAETLQ